MSLPSSRKGSTSSMEELQVYAQVLPYYHPYLKNLEQVTTIMKKYIDIDGSFLLRNSFRRPGVLAVSVLHKSGEKPGIKHFNINQSSGSFYLQDKTFNTLKDLVSYYAKADVPNVEGFKGVRLVHPIVEIDYGLLGGDSSQPQSPVSIVNGINFPSPSKRSSNSSSAGGSSPPGSGKSQRSMSHPPELPRRNTDFGLGSDIANRLSAGSNGSGVSPRKLSAESLSSLSSELRRRNMSESSLGDTIPENAEIDDTVLLPVSTKDKKENRKGGIFHLFARKGKENKPSRDEIVSEPDPYRPPAPPPRDLARCRSLPPSANGYAQVRDLSVDMTEQLIQQLRIQEDFHSSFECCECGILLEDTNLPLDWSVHRSRDKDSYGRLFFTGPNQETRWDLPLEVAIKLSPEQQDIISKLKEESLNYIHDINRIPSIKQPARQTRSSPSHSGNGTSMSPISHRSSRSSSSSGISVGRNSRNSDTDRTSGVTENEEVFW